MNPLAIDINTEFRRAQLRAYLLGIAANRGTVPFVTLVAGGFTAADLRAVFVGELLRGAPALTALVVSRSTGIAPAGFFTLAKEAGRYVDDVSPAEFWKRSVDAVYAAYALVPAPTVLAPAEDVAPAPESDVEARATLSDDGVEPIAHLAPEDYDSALS